MFRYRNRFLIVYWKDQTILTLKGTNPIYTTLYWAVFLINIRYFHTFLVYTSYFALIYAIFWLRILLLFSHSPMCEDRLERKRYLWRSFIGGSPPPTNVGALRHGPIEGGTSKILWAYQTDRRSRRTDSFSRLVPSLNFTILTKKYVVVAIRKAMKSWTMIF